MIVAVPNGLSAEETEAFKKRVLGASNRIMPRTEVTRPLSANIVLLTSLSLKPKHIDIQSRCLDSWVSIGCKVIAQNTAEEIGSLKPMYPQVHQWVQCDDVSDKYDYPTQRLYRLCETAVDENAVIINSDIEVLCKQSELQSFLSRSDGEFVLGIRWNHEGAPAVATEFEWGFDLITVSERQLDVLPDNMPYALGQPMWDYALPEILMRAGFIPRIPHERVLFHRDHPQHWNSNSHKFGSTWLEMFTGEKFDDVKFRRDIDANYQYVVSKYVAKKSNPWFALHSKLDPSQQWYYGDWIPTIPNDGCNCNSHWTEITSWLPPDFSSPAKFHIWAIDAHNAVNQRLGKPIWPNNASSPYAVTPAVAKLLLADSVRSTLPNELISALRMIDS